MTILLRTLAILALLLLETPAQAATYFVASTGNDSTGDGSLATPWLTLSRAVNPAPASGPIIAAGDVVNIVANGSAVNCDANLPNLQGTATTTIQSSKINLFWPIGWRTNPVNDITIYGKCAVTVGGAGITAQAETHGLAGGFNPYCTITPTVGTATLTLTCTQGLPNLAVGSQIELEINSQGNPAIPTILVPTPLGFEQHYYIVACSSSPACGAQNSTVQLSATPGGSPITITACNADCMASTLAAEPMQVDTSTSFITSPDNLANITNGTPVGFVSGGLQIAPGILPAPLQQDQIVYIKNMSGRTFQVAATPGGTPIALTTLGAGMVSMANTNVPHNWKISGIEIAPASGQNPSYLMLFGSGLETSIYGMVNHIEIDRCYFHDNPAEAQSPTRAIVENGQYISIHDSYIAGMRQGESQAIYGAGSYGPTVIMNTFLEASAEITLYGGAYPAYPISNQNKQFIGNYYYKPPVWKQTIGSGAPTGPCWYDTTDPQHAGGEWYRDSVASQNYQCNSGFVWAATASALPTALTIKNMAEHKSGRNFTFTGNLFNYSWASGQSGQAFAFHQAEGSGPAIANDHITVMYNKVQNVYNWMTQNSHCFNPAMQACAALPSNHTITHNLAIISLNACGIYTVASTCGTSLTTHNFDGYPAASQFWDHNTVLAPDASLPNSKFSFFGSSYLGGCGPFTPAYNFWTIKNSISTYDIQGTCTNGDGVLQNFFINSKWSRLAIAASVGGIHYVTPGATNGIDHIAQQVNNAAIGYAALPADFVNVAATDAHLTSASPFSAANAGATFLSDDGTDLGADIDLIMMATSGAAAGTPPWDAQSNLTISAGSTKAVARLNSPGGGACTWTLYSALARIPANVLVSVADSAGAAIRDGTHAEIPVSGLTASTSYPYKMDCSNEVVMIGSFSTRAAGAGASFTFDWPAATAMSYSVNANMSSPTNLGAATRQFIPVTANGLIYAAAGGQLPTILIAP